MPDAVRIVDGERLWTTRKIGLRAAFSPSVIGVAGWAFVEGGGVRYARLAVGGGPVTPARRTDAEARLKGARLCEIDRDDLGAALIAEIVAPDDAFRSARYRRRAAANALVAGLFGPESAPPTPRRSPRPRGARRPGCNGFRGLRFRPGGMRARTARPRLPGVCATWPILARRTCSSGEFCAPGSPMR